MTEVMLPVLLIPRGRTASPLLKVPTTLLPFLSLASAAASPLQRILELQESSSVTLLVLLTGMV